MTSRPVTYTEARLFARSEGCGWFVSRFYALLCVFHGVKVYIDEAPSSVPEKQP